MLALIIVVCIAAISTLGANASNTFSNVSPTRRPARDLIPSRGAELRRDGTGRSRQ